MCKNMTIEISVTSMQLTAVLNKVNLSCVLLTLVKHEGFFFQFMVSLTFHIHEEYDHFIRDKNPRFCMFGWSSLSAH